MMPAPLRRLIAQLDTAVTAPPELLPRVVTAALGESVADASWLPPDKCSATHDHYTRHLLYGDPGGRYSIVAIVWGREQQSPIHAHYTWCGVGVYSGEIAETYYGEPAAGKPPAPLRTVRRGAGALSFDQPLTGIHRIANPGDATAISLHVYGIGQDRITTGVNRILG